ncbi:MAG: M36 family metallopeptidase [Chloroflexota bacterium]|nr:M36 family metallopeptidase [Chloroflexota bacterium]
MCWDLLSSDPRCFQGYALTNLASRAPWDHEVRANSPTYTTKGNNASTSEAWGSPLTPFEQYRPADRRREYLDKTPRVYSGAGSIDPFSWTNQWYRQNCNQAAFGPTANRNDIDAAVTSLFANHNRMHDWSYYLGFTERNYNMQENNFGLTDPRRENDPEIGNAQAGALSGAPPIFLGRDNANQITLNDGIPPITNMYLWQPVSAGFYAPCVDGDYDFSVIGHEYGHAIQNRMVAGPDSDLSGHQPRAMGESWSDLTAVEYLAEHREYVKYPENQVQDVDPFAVGPYVTGQKQTGIRNYNMSRSDLNYSDLEYDPNGVTSPHADGEIWSATNYDIRQALVAKYNASYPATNDSLQQQCADNDRPVRTCPGNRRWIQIFHDAFLLMPSEVTMLDARDAYLAADQMRFGGANQRELWRAFARRGMGIGAASPQYIIKGQNGEPDTTVRAVENRDPRPNFETPVEANEATITFSAIAQDGVAGAAIGNARIFVGRYDARAVPIADTNTRTALSNRARFVPGTYQFAVQAPGYGLYRFTRTFAAGQVATLRISMPTNWASGSKGAVATGNGINKSKLIDDTEATNWVRPQSDVPIRGQQVTVNLAGTIARQVRRVQVSALLRPQNAEDTGDPQDVDATGKRVGDTEAQNRFTSLKQFEIWTCNAAAGKNCASAASFTRIYTSSANAFPSGRPRPLAPNMVMKSFDVPDTLATHVQLRVVTNQCTGTPVYQEQDADPANDSGCMSGSSQDQHVRAAELQVFTGFGGVR